MSARKRLLLIGWDSADWKIIHPLLDAGKMPALKRLVEGGISGNLATLEPQLSPMLWTSIATGKMAYHHGVHGFTEVDPVSGRVVPVSAATRCCKTLWEMLGERGLRSHVVGWFATQGERDLEGKMVSNMYGHLRGITPEQTPGDWPAPPAGTYWPEDLGRELDSLRVSPFEITGDDILRAFVPRAHEVDQKRDRRLHELAGRLAEAYSIQSAATWLMETDPEWDFMAVYFRAIDEVSHVFMPYHPPRMEGIPEDDYEMYRGVVEGIYRAHDMMLQRLVELAGPETAVVLVSDHGFHSDHLRPKFTPRVPAGITVWHRAQGVIAAAGPGFKQDELIYGARLLDIAPTVLHYFGLPVGEDLEGRVLGQAFSDSRPVAATPTWEAAGESRQRRGSLSEADSEALLEQFTALGYIDPLADDPSQAARETRRENRWNLARACLYGGRHETALPLLEECFAEQPERSDYGQLLARTQLQAGLADEAAETLQGCLASLGDGVTARLLMGSIETQRGNHESALGHLEAVRAADPDNLHLLFSLSECYLALRRWDEAEQTAERMLELDPGSAQAWLIRSRHHLHRGQAAEEAAAAALEAIGLQYGNPRSHFLLGAALAQSGDWTGAERALRNNLRLNPRNALAHRYLAQVYRALGRFAEAGDSELQSRVLRHAERDCDGKRMETVRRDALARAEERRQRSLKDADGGGNPCEGEASPGMTFTIVSGLPRSGTSLMMQILRAGGLELMHDGKRAADEDNLEGYWEWEEIMSLKKNPRVIEKAEGKVVKVISALLPALPPKHRYKIIFMRRPVAEVVESQWKMLENRGAQPKSGKEHLIATQETHVNRMLDLLRANKSIKLLEVGFPELVADPDAGIERVRAFLGDLVTGEPDAMVRTVRPELYRNR
ncbi:alkaline phosphatase family protein [Luteolibacter sp. Populi]|uniref:alkaline phosphatase family protein n=1 Tax=Luteolibacter sp. Populi TaxID=3230487 RepID=UPI0034667CF5